MNWIEWKLRLTESFSAFGCKNIGIEITAELERRIDDSGFTLEQKKRIEQTLLGEGKPDKKKSCLSCKFYFFYWDFKTKKSHCNSDFRKFKTYCSNWESKMKGD